MAVAVVHGGKTVYAKGFGVKDVRSGEKVDPDTVFQLASVSKPIASTVVAHQVGVNAIGWDTPIVSKLPWFALSDPAVTQMVNVGDMFSHRSGLPDHAGDLLEDLGYDRRYVLDRLRELPLDPFRISYAYTNFGLTRGRRGGRGERGQVVGGPRRSRSCSVRSGWRRRATGSPTTSRGRTAPIGHIHVDGRYEPLYIRDADPEAPAGGASSSVNDMTRWLAMVLANGSYDGKQIVDAKALLPAVTPQIVSSPATEPAMRSGFYGYGFNVGSTSAARMELSHSGRLRTRRGNELRHPAVRRRGDRRADQRHPGRCSRNADRRIRRSGAVRRGARGLVQALHRRVQADGAIRTGSLVGQQPPAEPAPAAPLASYVGDYNNDYWGPARVTEKDGKLQLALGTKLNVPLNHWDGNVFTYSWVSENSPPGSVSKATFDGDKLTLEYYDDRQEELSRGTKLTTVFATGLTDAEVAQAGLRRQDQRRAHPRGAQRLRHRAGQRVHPDQRHPRRAADHRAVHRVGDQRRLRAADHRQQRDRHHPGAARQADTRQARHRRAGETVGAQAIRH